MLSDWVKGYLWGFGSGFICMILLIAGFIYSFLNDFWTTRK